CTWNGSLYRKAAGFAILIEISEFSRLGTLWKASLPRIGRDAFHSVPDLLFNRSSIGYHESGLGTAIRLDFLPDFFSGDFPGRTPVCPHTQSGHACDGEMRGVAIARFDQGDFG